MATRFLYITPILYACSEIKVEATLSEHVSTVPILTWETDEDGESFVEYWIDDTILSTQSYPSGNVHKAFLYGLPPLTQVNWRAVTTIDGVILDDTGQITTGGIPSLLPNITIVSNKTNSTEGYLAGVIFAGTSSVFVINRKGQHVWYKLEEPSKNPSELEIESTGIIYNSFLNDHSIDDSSIQKVLWSGETEFQIQTPEAHHAFASLGGANAYLAVDIREWYDPSSNEKLTVVGDKIQIIDINGDIDTIFSTWDHFTPIITDEWYGGFYPQGGDWTHANSLEYNKLSDTFLVSFRNLNLILEIDRYGNILHQFGGSSLDAWHVSEGSQSIFYPHSAKWDSKGRLMMITTIEEQTSGVIYELDWTKHELVQVWHFNTGYHVYAQGMMHELENGNILINSGTSGTIWEITPNGEIVWEAFVEAGNAFGSTIPFESFYK